MQLGLQVVPVDVELDTLNVSSRLLKEAFKDHPDIKALFLTNLLGFCDDIDRVAEVCRESNVILIEDNCESLGTVYRGKKLGSYGVASTFSLFVGHHLSAIEGGIICTSDEELANMVTMVRAHGWARGLSDERRIELRKEHGIDEFYEQYTFYELGYNLRPTEITGFLGLTQLEYADEIIKLRQKNFAEFHKASLQVSSIHHLRADHIELVSNFAFPVVCKTERVHKEMLSRFREAHVEIRPLVAGNIVRQPFYRKLGGLVRALPNSDQVHDLGFYFPNHPELGREEIQRLQRCLTAG
jgi:CDP-6-deoxy-D-xylo-4-hexulose-3-dehydrase